MDVYVWYNPEAAKYEIGSRIDYELLVRRLGGNHTMQLLYRFNRLSSKIAEKVVTELNDTSERVRISA